MEFKGTGEEWILRTFPDGQMSVRTVSDSRKICVSRVQNHEESLANLTLIAASKNILVALQNMVASAKEGYVSFADIDFAETAIEKALNVK